MNKSKILGIVILLGCAGFIYKDDIKSYIPQVGPSVSQEVKDLGNEIKKVLPEGSSNDFFNIGNMLIHESNLFKMNQERYPGDREIKAKLYETVQVSAGYQYGVNISKYEQLTNFLVNYLNNKIGEESFTSEFASKELRLIGEALRYAAK